MNWLKRIKTNFAYHRSTWVWAGAIVFVVMMLLWLGRQQLAPVIDFLKDRDQVEIFLAALGVWGPLVYVLILMAQVFIAIIPGQVLMMAAGYLYGFWGGVTLNFLAVIVASQLAFTFSRRAGQPAVEHFIPENVLNRWTNVTKRGSFFFFLICFWFPIIPSSATNYIAGLSYISGWLFLLASIVGRLPGVILFTLIGSHGLTLTWQQWMVVIPLAILLIIGGRYVTAKLERRFQAPA